MSKASAKHAVCQHAPTSPEHAVRVSFTSGDRACPAGWYWEVYCGHRSGGPFATEDAAKAAAPQ